MKKNKANPTLVMVLSALSAGLLISCVKPADEKQATDNDSQKVVEENSATADTTDANAIVTAAIVPVNISVETEKTYLNTKNNFLITIGTIKADTDTQRRN